MNIILFGCPGSGKGTQAEFIINKYKIPHISTGNILRHEIKKKSYIGKKVFNIIKKGKLVDDKIIIKLIKNRINKKDCKLGYLLDGFPRTIKQANLIKKKNITIDIVFEIFTPEKIIIERLSGRRIHTKSGRIYHIKYNPPKNHMIDDITGDLLDIRLDDNKKIIKKRLINFYKKTYPLINFFYKESLNNNIKFFKINNFNNIQKTSIKIFKIIDKYFPKKY
ncbi:adenylate kinase [Sodalis-like secondary symbiont of Drepanosiphum platanoidis]|uniref:adenylate kinase n=1 Tax=Sodalis-like secondary symbiont of Drepanosiphum platanoidis TaxID=2994493 RepID=UPI003463DB3A